MNTAVGIIERRVNGLGVSEAEVQTQGDEHIIVNIPKGTNEKQAREQVGTTAQLYFRPVLDRRRTAAPAATPSPPRAVPRAPSRERPATKAQTARTRPAPSGTPSSSATTQGRAVTRRPEGAATPTPPPAPPASDGKTPAPRPVRPRAPPATRPPPTLEKKFTALDCTNRRSAPRPATGVKPEDPIVACGQTRRRWEQVRPRPGRGRGQGRRRRQGRSSTSSAACGSSRWSSPTRAPRSSPDDHRQAGAASSPRRTSSRSSLDGEVVSAPSVSQTLSGRRRDLRQLHPAVRRGPGQHALVRRAAAVLRARTASPPSPPRSAASS